MPLRQIPVVNRFFTRNPHADLKEKAIWQICRISTIVSGVALGALVGMTVFSVIAGVGIGMLSFLSFGLCVRLIQLTKNDTLEKKALGALASAVCLVGAVALGLSGIVFLSSMIHQIAMMTLAIGIGYFTGKITYQGIQLLQEELNKESVDFWNIAGAAALGIVSFALGKTAWVLLGSSPLMAIATIAIATSVTSDEILTSLRHRVAVLAEQT
jgi:hypothetical protein